MSSDQYCGGVHFATGALAATCCLYNGLKWIESRQRRHGVNVLVYALLWGWEGYQTQRHWRA